MSKFLEFIDHCGEYPGEDKNLRLPSDNKAPVSFDLICNFITLG